MKVSRNYRYVDDTFFIIPKDKIDYVLKKFTAYHPRLKFTHEIENNNSIPFLNFKIIRDKDGINYTVKNRNFPIHR